MNASTAVTFIVPILGIGPADVITQNSTRRMHWRKIADAQQLLKGCAIVSLRHARVPKHLGPVEIVLHYAPQTAHHRDPDGIASTLKPLIDALVFTHTLADDTSAHVRKTSQVIEPVEAKARLWLTITEVTE